MLPEIGHLALIFSLCFSLCLSVLPLWGVYRGAVVWMLSAHAFVIASFSFLLISFFLLIHAFIVDDFSVKYVAHHSTTFLPTIYKVSAVWGGHEGSLLLWALILSGWALAVSLRSRGLPLEMVARVLAVMGMISVGFNAFLLWTSNPFERLLPFAPTQGRDLNPLLQDPGLIIHPPMLYMGYVGLSVAFAFAIAALLSGRLDSAWARWSRPWTTVAWVFLTLGIALGSWWAYYELGWGGWWFWDPVENASLMPWLAATALIHSLAVTEKRGLFKSWTILLAILAFSLSLLGTFLVRSGVLTSVHAFASDPERGLFILLFLVLVTGGSLVLYALKVPQSSNVIRFGWLSREVFLLKNNILLTIILLTVLGGTLFPLIATALDLGKYSVGAPYFNLFFVPLVLLLCALMGLGVLLSWKKTQANTLKKSISLPFLLSISLGFLLPLLGESYRPMAVLVISIAAWVVFTQVVDIWQKIRHAKGGCWAGLYRLRPSYYGMVLAHLGVVLAVLGGGLSSIYSQHRDVRMEVGQTVTLGTYQYKLEKVSQVLGPNYRADQARIVVSDGQWLTVLKPQKRRYFSGGNIMTEAAIDSGFWADIYVALGEKLSSEEAWAVRLHFKPFINWIWWGAIFMALGGVIAIIDKRYRAHVEGGL